jgi:hypothetical protein
MITSNEGVPNFIAFYNNIMSILSISSHSVYPPSIQGAGSVRPFHASDVRAPEGTGNLAIKIPKGT